VRLDESHVVADFACHTGEGPLWHPDEEALYWIDIPRGRVYRFNPVSGKSEVVHEQDCVGALTLEADGALLLFGPNGRVDRWPDGQVTNLIGDIPCAIGTRFNDAIADAHGRVVAGTMPIDGRPSHLVRIGTDRAIKVLHADLGLSNGMAFSPDDSELFHSDTARRTVVRYRYEGDDLACGEIVFTASAKDGSPDGLAIDAEDCLWSARWGGHCVMRHSPAGAELSRIELPTPNVSSIAFGGPDLRDLYITTAGGDDRSKNGPLAGALFRVRVEVAGRPPYRSRIGGRPA
jgi:D-xylono/L-arabinono-1,4-lactonase